jgi:hypothetical protein
MAAIKDKNGTWFTSSDQAGSFRMGAGLFAAKVSRPHNAL